MDDLISRQDAIELLSEMSSRYNCFDESERQFYEALSVAIEALSCSEKPNMSDTIYRQDAIDALDKRFDVVPMELTDEILQLRRDLRERIPSAQPDIIRCKDCKWWDKSEDSPFGYCMAMKHGYMSANWEIGIYRRYKGDFYCADAERKTDE